MAPLLNAISSFDCWLFTLLV